MRSMAEKAKFPTTRYHPTLAPKGRKIHTPMELAKLGEDWVDSPDKLPKVEPQTEPANPPACPRCAEHEKEIERLKQEWTEVSAAEKADFQQQWEELSAKATTLAAARDRLLKENAGMREQLSRAIKPQAKLKADIIPRKGPGSEPPPAA